MKSIIVALVPVFLVACAPGEEPLLLGAKSAGIVPLAAPMPGQGIQLGMTKTIAPGEESYGCRLFQVPDDGMFVHEQTVYFGPGGHHVLLYKTPYGAIPEMAETGALIDAAEVHDCSEGVTALWKVDSVLGGSEIMDHPGMLRGLPEGVAVHLPGKTVVVMSVHYLNASSEPSVVDARMNLNSIPAQDVKMEAGLLYLDNQLLHVPPMGTSRARMRCPVPSDVFIVNLQSHMHARGLSFSAEAFDSGGMSSGIMYETQKWLEPPVQSYKPFMELSAGQTIEMQCNYASSEARTIGYGPQASDEMCQLIGPYFPRDERFEACANAGGVFAAEWIGHGSSSGKKTRECLECGIDSPDYVGCIYDACPAIAARVSAAVRCELARGARACAAEMNALAQATCSK
ncbi:MAG: hypothetical protein IPM54_18185 [Polyangiaceae bacterium]|nr:hypothetical protein [Polyangiaceae bacterium]